MIGLPVCQTGGHADNPVIPLRQAVARRDAIIADTRSFEHVDYPLRDDAGKILRSALRAARLPPRTLMNTTATRGMRGLPHGV